MRPDIILSEGPLHLIFTQKQPSPLLTAGQQAAPVLAPTNLYLIPLQRTGARVMRCVYTDLAFRTRKQGPSHVGVRRAGPEIFATSLQVNDSLRLTSKAATFVKLNVLGDQQVCLQTLVFRLHIYTKC